jgi:nucleotide-binding universal stress UspA family protein
MGISNPCQAPSPTLDNLAVNPRLARRLAPTLACRYHALPVAEANGQVTVAMANPDDALARETVTNALGAPSYVVGGDPLAIDTLLAEVWPELFRRSLRLLVCAHACPNADEVLTFARALGGLLDAHLSYLEPLEGSDTGCEALARATVGGAYDLAIWGEAERLLSAPAYGEAAERVPAARLMARQPRWPLKRLLMVVQGKDVDEVTVDWVVRLARPSGAAVTALAVVPPLPAMYGGCARMQQGLDALLTTDTALGRQMRRVARWLVDWEVEGTLRLRQGAPDQQIRREITTGDYDLIAVAARPRDRWRRWLLGDGVAPLLRWADRPVLIAQPKTA